MVDLLRSPITVIWALLIAATGVSWWLGKGGEVSDPDLAGALVLIVAFVKVRFVGMYFMELRHAPLPLKLIYEGWCIAVATTVVTLFLVG